MVVPITYHSQLPASQFLIRTISRAADAINNVSPKTGGEFSEIGLNEFVYRRTG